jgi:glycosyltransferase involved in cell wall biosynthesis
MAHTFTQAELRTSAVASSAARTGALRLCIVSEEFYPEDRGGLGTQAFQLAKYLATLGMDVNVVTRKTLAESPRREVLDGLAISRLPPTGVLKGAGWRAIVPTMRFLLSLIVWLVYHSRQYDVLLVQGVKGTLLPAMVMKVLFRKRYVIKIDAAFDIVQDIAPESLAKMGLSSRAPIVRIWKRLRTRVLRNSAALVAISSEIRTLLRERGLPEGRIRAIPNGIDLERFYPVSDTERAQLRQRLGIEGSPLAIYTGRLARAKGLHVLLAAWESFVRTHPDAQLVLVGSGAGSHDDCEDELREWVASKRLQSCISFSGQVDNVAEYLQAADFFVSVSESEGFGLALAEAMASGLPCISTPVGIAPEVLVNGVNGSLVAIDRVDALAAALVWMTSHSEHWSIMGANARDAVVSRYDMQAVGNQYAELIRSAARVDR